jgi:hypothetical protein
MRLTNLEHDNLNPALAGASTLNEASAVLNVFVLKIWTGIYENSKKTNWQQSKTKYASNIAIWRIYLGGSYSKASIGNW